MLKRTSEQCQQLCETLIYQLTKGGHAARLNIMSGAKDFGYSDNEDGSFMFNFKYPSKGTKNKTNYCSITLNTRDLYDIEFRSVRGFTTNNLKGRFEDYYEDMLHDLFVSETGLDLTF